MKQAQVNGFTMAYRDEGNGPPLLLVHAFPLTSAVWNLQIEEFRRNYRVIAPDLRGLGGSADDLTSDRPVSMDEYADDLAALLDAIGLTDEPVIYMGLSMGGYIAFAFWRRHAHRVRAFVLCDTRSEADTEEGRQGRYQLIEAVRQTGSSAAAEIMLPRLFAPDTYRLRPDLVGETSGLIERNSPAGIMAAAAGLAARPDSTPDLAGINVPCLVVVGQQDVLTPPETARRLAQALPDWQLSLVPHAGHLSNLENPEFFNQALTTFLKGLPL